MTAYFWPLVGAVWFLGTRFAAPRLAHRGGNREALAALCRRLGVLVLGLSLVIWAIQLSAGPVEHVHIMSSWPAPQKWLALAAVLLTFLGVAAWIVVGGGGRSVADAFGTDEGRVKTMTGLGLLAVSAANVWGYLI